MEWLDKMNAALNYIEDNLAGEINYAEAAKRACSSSYNFQRMFSFIADVPLAEYIRRRRLTLAALDFQKGGESVLDISLKYGYDSPVSFARAFQNLHGVTPKEAREKGVLLTLYPRISFKITIKGVDEMKYRIEKVQGFRLAGAVKTVTTVNGENFRVIPQMWQDACEDGTMVKMKATCKEGRRILWSVLQSKRRGVRLHDSRGVRCAIIGRHEGADYRGIGVCEIRMPRQAARGTAEYMETALYGMVPQLRL